jgi:hypothetical protein
MKHDNRPDQEKSRWNNTGEHCGKCRDAAGVDNVAG